MRLDYKIYIFFVTQKEKKVEKAYMALKCIFMMVS